MSAPLPAPSWDALRASWPNAESSRFVESAGVRWHVQVAGTGPVVLLLHGTGGATHSWRDVLPVLCKSFTVVAPDLPGHGFTSAPDTGGSIDGVARAVRSLCDTLALKPAIAAGHSAGVAILLAMARDAKLSTRGERSLRGIAGFGAALVPPPAAYRELLAPLVNPIALSSWAARLGAALGARRTIVDALLNDTGSTVPESQRALYRTLFSSPAHVQGAMALMANWDIPALLRSLTGTADAKLPPVTLYHGTQDAFVPIAKLRAVALPFAQIVPWEGAGHLLHEERPAAAAEAIAALISDPGPADRAT